MTNSILSGIKAISFDFWYTIARYETEAEWKRQDEIRVEDFSRILTNHGFNFSKELIENTLRQIEEECDAERSRTEMEIASRELVSRFCKRLGIKKQIAGGQSALLKAFDEALLKVKIIAEPGVLKTLDKLKRMGYPLALLSNTSHGHVIKKIMDTVGLTPFFDILLYTDEIGPRKPNREAFNILLKKLETQAKETLHIGDRPELDVLGARRLGIRSVLYQWNSNCSKNTSPRPDFCITSLEELIKEEFSTNV